MPTTRERVAIWGRTIFRVLGQNRVSQVGVVVTTATGISMVFLWIIEILQGGHQHPYSGIILFLILPALFVAGLLLIPAGFVLQRRRDRKEGHAGEPPPPIDLASPKFRRVLTFVAIATLANATLVGFASYKGLEVMDSVGFCGEACHTVMAPELAAYRGSPHSRIGCVECHIGAGASWFVKSKLSGTRQVFAVAFRTYSTPIPSPVHQLRPARETCEECHWPQRFTGDRVLVKRKYSEDEKNTLLTTVLVMHVGGQNAQGSVGIHGRHLDTGSRITYTAVDERRQKIATVSYRDDTGKTVEFTNGELKATPAQISAGETRAMDCVDCHNRPTHIYRTPEQELDAALLDRRIDSSLPYVRREGLKALQAEYPTPEAARAGIAKAISDFYRQGYPQLAAEKAARVEAAGKALGDIWNWNVFPSMNIKWGTYRNQIGHTPDMSNEVGCFRCHDEQHATKEGRTISQDCSTCHSLLAQDERDPAILKTMVQ